MRGDIALELQNIIKDVQNCPCGRVHKTEIKAVVCESGLLRRVGDVLQSYSFPDKILVVSDRPAFEAADGLMDELQSAGFSVQLKIYDLMRVADMRQVEELESLCDECGGILAVGTGSIDDICRLCADRKQKDFAIFATAPSMDGFASDTAPITRNNFKMSYQARQPSVIMADTRILSRAPTELKSAGFGDMIAKYIALVDWKIASLLSGEYYCDRIANITETALKRIVALADKVTEQNEETAAAIFESLVLTGIAMGFAGCSRPASGAEHIVSHFWEIKKLESGELSDFHGKKVGVATVLINRLYRKTVEADQIQAHEEHIDWDRVCTAYGPMLAKDMMKMNQPTVTSGISPALLTEKWPEIRQIVQTILPTDQELLSLMRRAGAVVTPADVGVSDELCELGMKYHSFMRHRITLARLLPMILDDNS